MIRLPRAPHERAELLGASLDDGQLGRRGASVGRDGGARVDQIAVEESIQIRRRHERAHRRAVALEIHEDEAARVNDHATANGEHLGHRGGGENQGRATRARIT